MTYYSPSDFDDILPIETATESSNLSGPQRVLMDAWKAQAPPSVVIATLRVTKATMALISAARGSSVFCSLSRSPYPDEVLHNTLCSIITTMRPQQELLAEAAQRIGTIVNRWTADRSA